MRQLRAKEFAAPEPPAGSAEWSRDLRLVALTPIYKGGANPRGIDDLRPFRGAAIRGVLRSWWRATSPLTDAGALFDAERALFGGVHGRQRSDPPVASRVRVGVTDSRSEARAAPSGFNYALWPHDLSLRKGEEDERAFHREGASAKLRVSFPSEVAGEVDRALKAWLLIGGVGSRTRRGLGAVWDERHELVDKPRDAAAYVDALRPLVPLGRRDWPTLAGLRVLTGPSQGDAMKAWKKALDAMQTMRTKSEQARPIKGAPPPPACLFEDVTAIKAGRGEVPGARASLGLPLQFKLGRTVVMEPAGRDDNRAPSPVHLRPVPLADGRFLPVMVVLSAPYPERFSVGRQQGTVDPRGVTEFVKAVVELGWTLHRPGES